MLLRKYEYYAGIEFTDYGLLLLLPLFFLLLLPFVFLFIILLIPSSLDDDRSATPKELSFKAPDEVAKRKHRERFSFLSFFLSFFPLGEGDCWAHNNVVTPPLYFSFSSLLFFCYFSFVLSSFVWMSGLNSSALLKTSHPFFWANIFFLFFPSL